MSKADDWNKVQPHLYDTFPIYVIEWKRVTSTFFRERSHGGLERHGCL